MRARIRATAPVCALVALSYAFRWPALLNADSTNSDAAIVGLQATHLLRGEWSPFLWGSGYQTSVDSAVAAAFFAILGPTPRALMLSALTLHVVLTLLVYATLRRHLDGPRAAIASLPLVFTTSAVHTYALYPPRQASLTLAVLALFVLERSSGARRRAGWLAAGALIFGLARFADPYPTLLAPVILGYGLALALEGRDRLRATLALGAGAALGQIPVWLLAHAPGANPGPMGLTTDVAAHNQKLLVGECLPWALGSKVYYAKHVMDYSPWDMPDWLHAALGLSVALSVTLVVTAIPLTLSRRVPWGTRALGVAGAATWPVAIAAFLVSVMVMDHFSMRYLAVLTLMTPLALAPLASRISARALAALVLPACLAGAVGGWVGYGPFVRGPLPVVPREIADDHALRARLEAAGVRYAMADYWTAYRLTLLYQERIVFVPRNAREDRHAEYRRAFEAAPRFAYLHDPGRSRESLAEAEATVRATSRRYERVDVGALVVFVADR